MNTPRFSTFIPAAGDPEHKKFVLDIDSIIVDGDESIVFPTGTPRKVAEEFMAFLVDEVGTLDFDVFEMEHAEICVHFDAPLSPEIQDEVEDLIIDLANSLRKV